MQKFIYSKQNIKIDNLEIYQFENSNNREIKDDDIVITYKKTNIDDMPFGYFLNDKLIEIEKFSISIKLSKTNENEMIEKFKNEPVNAAFVNYWNTNKYTEKLSIRCFKLKNKLLFHSTLFNIMPQIEDSLLNIDFLDWQELKKILQNLSFFNLSHIENKNLIYNENGDKCIDIKIKDGKFKIIPNINKTSLLQKLIFKKIQNYNNVSIYEPITKNDWSIIQLLIDESKKEKPNNPSFNLITEPNIPDSKASLIELISGIRLKMNKTYINNHYIHYKNNWFYFYIEDNQLNVTDITKKDK